MRRLERFADFAKLGIRKTEIPQRNTFLIDVAGLAERGDRLLGLARAGDEIALVDRGAAEQPLGECAVGDAFLARLLERRLRRRLLRGRIDDFMFKPGERDV